MITGEGEGGISSGEVIQAVEEISKEVLPKKDKAVESFTEKNE